MPSDVSFGVYLRKALTLPDMTGPLECRNDKCCDGRIGNRKYFKTFWKLLVFSIFSSFLFSIYFQASCFQYIFQLLIFSIFFSFLFSVYFPAYYFQYIFQLEILCTKYYFIYNSTILNDIR